MMKASALDLCYPSYGTYRTLIVLGSKVNSFFIVFKLMFGGMSPFSSTSMLFINPAIPLELSQCPIFALTDPRYNGAFRVPDVSKTFSIALTSALSPATVPVPCV